MATPRALTAIGIVALAGTSFAWAVAVGLSLRSCTIAVRITFWLRPVTFDIALGLGAIAVHFALWPRAVAAFGPWRWPSLTLGLAAT